MVTKSSINHEDFEKLMLWLDRDRETAGEKYEQIRLQLIKIFQARKCYAAEELADETIDREIKNAGKLIHSYEGNPVLYFYGVARNVYLEYARRPQSAELPDDLIAARQEPEVQENRYNCFEECLETLGGEDRRLIVGYYRLGKDIKVDQRRNLASGLGVSTETLRMRVSRMRQKLQNCFRECTKNAPEEYSM